MGEDERRSRISGETLRSLNQAGGTSEQRLIVRGVLVTRAVVIQLHHPTDLRHWLGTVRAGHACRRSHQRLSAYCPAHCRFSGKEPRAGHLHGHHITSKKWWSQDTSPTRHLTQTHVRKNKGEDEGQSGVGVSPGGGLMKPFGGQNEKSEGTETLKSNTNC